MFRRVWAVWRRHINFPRGPTRSLQFVPARGSGVPKIHKRGLTFYSHDHATCVQCSSSSSSSSSSSNSSNSSCCCVLLLLPLLFSSVLWTAASWVPFLVSPGKHCWFLTLSFRTFAMVGNAMQPACRSGKAGTDCSSWLLLLLLLLRLPLVAAFSTLSFYSQACPTPVWKPSQRCLIGNVA